VAAATKNASHSEAATTAAVALRAK